MTSHKNKCACFCLVFRPAIGNNCICSQQLYLHAPARRRRDCLHSLATWIPADSSVLHQEALGFPSFSGMWIGVNHRWLSLPGLNEKLRLWSNAIKLTDLTVYRAGWRMFIKKVGLSAGSGVCLSLQAICCTCATTQEWPWSASRAVILKYVSSPDMIESRNCRF